VTRGCGDVIDFLYFARAVLLGVRPNERKRKKRRAEGQAVAFRDDGIRRKAKKKKLVKKRWANTKFSAANWKDGGGFQFK